ncbi:Uncharacterised protein [Yersinia enterocolitica]|nr:Uncharacterised protein [Yersinia enterocolitica]CNI76963.1 Uncharacterised protein [Yersinia enterocolitica]CQD45432.1 Uncharacterised protein [Yersinia enterocolitica]CQH55693.1 Uncharacterised protein [Yersinia enterocolitica]CQH62062.1 Uncharacterised protein [Yersinia enterocolitica]
MMQIYRPYKFALSGSLRPNSEDRYHMPLLQGNLGGYLLHQRHKPFC